MILTVLIKHATHSLIHSTYKYIAYHRANTADSLHYHIIILAYILIEIKTIKLCGNPLIAMQSLVGQIVGCHTHTHTHI